MIKSGKLPAEKVKVQKTVVVDVWKFSYTDVITLKILRRTK